MNSDAILTKPTVIPQSTPLSQALWIAAFAAATALGARVEIPNVPVPYTLQTLFVLLAGAFLGPRNGAISMMLYLAVGALGAPVFSSGGFGLAKLVGPTGGYLAAFPIAAALVGYLVHHSARYAAVLGSMFAGLLLIFTLGTMHLYSFYIQDFSTAFASGFLIFSWWDVMKLFAASTIYHEVAKRWRRLG